MANEADACEIANLGRVVAGAFVVAVGAVILAGSATLLVGLAGAAVMVAGGYAISTGLSDCNLATLSGVISQVSGF